MLKKLDLNFQYIIAKFPGTSIKLKLWLNGYKEGVIIVVWYNVYLKQNWLFHGAGYNLWHQRIGL